MEKDKWFFKVHSASTSGKTYKVAIKFRNILNLLFKALRDEKIWKEGQEEIDYRKLAIEIFPELDMEIGCECPAFQYWGGAYILTKRGSKYGRPETRRPKIRNPHEYGAFCKHIQLVQDLLPMYASTFSKYLKQTYAKEIAELLGDIEKGRSEK